MPTKAKFHTIFYLTNSKVTLFLTVFAIIRRIQAHPLIDSEQEPQEPDICKDYPLLHLCLIRPMLKGALAEISYLVNNAAFVNNEPEDSHSTGQLNMPLELSPSSFFLQDEENTLRSKIVQESSTEQPTTTTTKSMPDYSIHSKNTHYSKRHITPIHALLSFSSLSIPKIPTTNHADTMTNNNLQTRSLFVRPSSGRRKKASGSSQPIPVFESIIMKSNIALLNAADFVA